MTTMSQAEVNFWDEVPAKVKVFESYTIEFESI